MSIGFYDFLFTVRIFIIFKKVIKEEVQNFLLK